MEKLRKVLEKEEPKRPRDALGKIALGPKVTVTEGKRVWESGPCRTLEGPEKTPRKSHGMVSTAKGHKNLFV